MQKWLLETVGFLFASLIFAVWLELRKPECAAPAQPMLDSIYSIQWSCAVTQ